MLQPFGERLWLADGPLAHVAGFAYPTRMAVIRLAGGGLFILSPVALTEAMQTAVEVLGEIDHIVAPNGLHDLHLSAWNEVYPGARLHAPPGLRARRKDLDFTDELGDAPSPDWAGDIDQVVVRGNAITTEVVFFHKPSRTVLFTDLIQHFEPGWFKGWRAVVAKLDLMTAPEPEVPRKFRTAFTDRAAARASIRRILEWPAEQVVMAHAPPVPTDGQAFMRKRFSWLKV